MDFSQVITIFYRTIFYYNIFLQYFIDANLIRNLEGRKEVLIENSTRGVIKFLFEIFLLLFPYLALLHALLWNGKVLL